jgi:Cof subfamily protein (haloacid dehalogenase superfamily)
VSAVRLIVLDIDGTLLTSTKAIAPRTRAAIASARARGVRLALATGRRYPSTRPVAADLGGDPPLIVHNGALVIEAGEIVRCRPLEREVAARVIAVGRARGADFVVHSGQRGEGHLLVDAFTARTGLVAFYLARSREHVVEVEDVGTLAEDPIQVMFGGRPEQMRELRPALQAEIGTRARVERTVYPRNDVEILDVVDAAVGKAEAVRFLQKRLGIAAAETLAIGDNWNDKEMLLEAGRAFVMGGGDPELGALGLPVLPSSDEDGVALAIEQHIL